MNTAVPNSIRPLVALERNSSVSQALKFPLNVAGGGIYRVSGLSLADTAMPAQSIQPSLILAGKPLKSKWAESAPLVGIIRVGDRA